MSGVETTRLLGEMQRLASVADARPSETTAGPRGFAELLRTSIDGVAEAQAKANVMAAARSSAATNR
jgi:flagellar hook-basal body complex protein FliE